ncbi:MAG TPA: glycosyl hydrolase 53 family protein [Phycisphaerae bacterium]
MRKSAPIVCLAMMLSVVGGALWAAAPAPAGGQAAPAAATAETSTVPSVPIVMGRTDYFVGADISWIQQREDQGQKYSDNGVTKDILTILKDHGFNYIRLRVFNDPTKPNKGNATAYSPQGYCDLPHTIAMAKRVKAAGMKLLIDFHYSDSWADPGKQYAPAAWVSLTNEELAKTLHDWTKDSVTKLKDAGAMPDMVQVGNEITPGMMTDKGGTTRDWPQLAKYLKAGLTAVKEVDPKIMTMLHIDRGGDNPGARRWVDGALGQGVEFDVLGLSCYSKWHGPPSGWKANFEDLSKRYPKIGFVMAEVDNQATEANDIMMGLPDRRGLGTFIWEPEANNANQALFVQGGGGGGRGARGAGAVAAAGGGLAPAAPAVTAPATTAPATMAAGNPAGGSVATPAPARGGRGGGGVVAVDPTKMVAYDKVLEKYGLKKLP